MPTGVTRDMIVSRKGGNPGNEKIPLILIYKEIEAK
jgi:hypothetical protein